MYSIPVSCFDLDHTLGCGQVFRWTKEDDWWHGVVQGDYVHAFYEQEAETLYIDSRLPVEFFVKYFRLDDDLPCIFSSIDHDPYVHEAISKYRGLRLIRQDPWECLVSYMIATASNIPRIMKSIEKLSRLLGREIVDGIYAFPEISALAACCGEDLCDCSLGFRARRLIKAARMIESGELDLYGLYDMDYFQAKQQLMNIEGIGEKVADCILLFSYGKMEAFPVDTHVDKVIRNYYSDIFEGPYTKPRMAEWARSYFGHYCGYAQQYLFYQHRREGKLGSGMD
ncbi:MULTISPECIES: DNA-3-methyladenine glycosylase family protein [Methanohalophilus]|jgi:N-glycosylase/DNA lyase|uniref:DNA-(apurinic or apyrimidinic site) lyase n=1 Tax=Methanohalophilus euhalobius TaxID=51203 RepID=A0A314ZU15_9EURY|nr:MULTISPECIES: DNA glycosylase [Methanohalophilus]OBZ34399.1 MAG: 8-oxoguanine DNA glycosylase [Methanohalophilus sp. DAL1]PQV42472.1 N-glycosylase/DNA lyase [Methanohalophilus euhalobius]RNI08221.1 DNA-3-methyladenine glycosylase 2 family protein [Methanohalophilus euhalobius]